MRWYWHLAGGHVLVRVFMNGAKCGDLVFLAHEFSELHNSLLRSLITFLPDDLTREPVIEAIKEAQP